MNSFSNGASRPQITAVPGEARWPAATKLSQIPNRARGRTIDGGTVSPISEVAPRLRADSATAKPLPASAIAAAAPAGPPPSTIAS
jgi:hypothetical protein